MCLVQKEAVYIRRKHCARKSGGQLIVNEGLTGDGNLIVRGNGNLGLGRTELGVGENLMARNGNQRRRKWKLGERSWN